MSIHESKKQSDLEKRLKLLRQQVYGKSRSSAISYQSSGKKEEKSDNYSTKTDISYLYQDLIKILTLASLAIGAQIILFFLTKNHILKFNLFWREVN